MKSLRIVILGFENALPSGISGYVDLFVLAGMAFRRSPMSASLPSFEIIVATPNGQPFSDGHGRKVKPDRACEDIDHADAVLIAGFFPNERACRRTTKLSPAWPAGCAIAMPVAR
ncbi:hypothetical protein [Nevskia sp.]|uniref:hypothetical protein n=1 Tax=Nevskia sp. TaxID=1929292 RepID=UPI0025CEAB3D|nr:hypothetical protein [Nevskia sp.]